MKRKIIIGIVIIIIIIIIMTICITCCYDDITSNFITEEYINDYKNNELENNLKSNINMRIMLADILNYDNEILITEDNIDNTETIIEKANLKYGIYVVEDSREKFKAILDEVFGSDFYAINSEGYIEKNNGYNENDSLSKKINNYIISNKNLLIIHVSSTYKNILDNGAILDFMIENTTYVQIFDYSETTKIALVNPEKLTEKNEDLTKKEIYEEILLNIFN